MASISHVEPTTEDPTVAEFAQRLSQAFRRAPEEETANDGASEPAVERRAHERRDFSEHALVAPWDASKEPRKLDYRPCRCRNLSEAGIAFWSHARPDAKRLAIHLQVGGNDVQLKAQVVHVAPERDGDEDGYIVGCRLEGRIA